MRIITIEEREGEAGLSRIVARFAIGTTLESQVLPEISELVDIRESLYDYIKSEKDRVIKALDEVEVQAKRDAELLSDVATVEAKTLAAAEAHEAFVAGQAKRAKEAGDKARKAVKEREKAMKK